MTERKVYANMQSAEEDCPLLSRERGVLLGYCESCGLEVYESDDGLFLKDNGDLIHHGCWDYYAADNVERFTVRPERSEGASC